MTVIDTKYVINCSYVTFVGVHHVVISDLPQKVWSSDDHGLEVLQGQTSVVVQVRLIDHLLTHHPHLVLRQLVTGQFVQSLLQVGLAEKVIIVEILQNIEIKEIGNYLSMNFGHKSMFEYVD